MKKYQVFYESSTRHNFETNSWNDVENGMKNENGIVYFTKHKGNAVHTRQTVKFFDNKKQ